MNSYTEYTIKWKKNANSYQYEMKNNNTIGLTEILIEILL